MKLVIIGAGPGGYAAAFRAARRGASVTLIDKDTIGGTCLNRGCIPSKIMRRSADAMRQVREAGVFGVEGGATSPALNLSTVRKRQQSIVQSQAAGLAAHCKTLGIALIRGTARVEQPGVVLADTAEGSREFAYDNLLVACGSAPASIPGLEVNGVTVISSDDALWMEELPKSLLVVGGGVIGCELAQIFQDFGVGVTLVEGLPRILPVPGIDEEIAKNFMRSLKKAKLPFFTGQTVAGIRESAGGVTALLRPFSGEGESREMEFSKVLVAIGRKSVARELGLENIGVTLDARGWIEADESFQTSAPHVWAIGDCLGPSRIMLAHVAGAEGSAAVENMYGGTERVNYAAIPSAVFTAPEIGCVGLTLAQAEERKPGSVARDFLFRQLGKAQAMGEIDGLVRLVVGPEGEMLGGHIIGASATSLIAEVGLAVSNALPAEAVAGTIHAHPTLPEGIWEAALSAVGRPLHGA